MLERADDVGGTWRDNSYPGLRLRRALAPVLVLVRAEPRVDEHLLAAARDLGLPARLRGALRGPAARPLRPRAARRGWDEDAQRWRLETSRGDADRAGARARRPGRSASRRSPTCPGLERFEGAIFHSATGTTTTTSTASAWPSSARAPPRSSSCRRSSRGSGACTSSSARRRGSCRAPTAPLKALRAAPVPRLPAAQLLMRAGIYWARESFVLGFRHPRVMRLGAAPRAGATCAARCRDPELRRKLTPDLPHGLQARPDLQRLPAGARAARTSRSSPTPSARCARDSIVTRRRHRARGRHDHLRHRLPRHRPAGRRARARPRRALAGRGLGRQPAGPPRHDGRRLPEPLLPRRPQHRPGAQLDRLHDRVADATTCSTPCASWTRRGAAELEVRPEAQAAYNARHPGADARHGVDLGRLRELVPRRQRAQHDAVADLHLALPRAHAPARPRALRAARAAGGAREAVAA